MTISFLIEDPRGYKVECYEERLNKIFEEKHPELYALGATEEDIQEAIKNPKDCIYLATKGAHEGSYIYYGKIMGKITELKVVVKFDENNIGEVRDAYPCSGRSEFETIIWPVISH